MDQPDASEAGRISVGAGRRDVSKAAHNAQAASLGKPATKDAENQQACGKGVSETEMP